MATLYQDGDKVVLDLGEEPKRDVLFSLEVAKWMADRLEEVAGKALRSPGAGNRNLREPSIETRAINNRGVGQIQLVFGWWSARFYLCPSSAFALASMVRQASGVAERFIKDREERNPKALLT